MQKNGWGLLPVGAFDGKDVLEQGSKLLSTRYGGEERGLTRVRLTKTRTKVTAYDDFLIVGGSLKLLRVVRYDRHLNPFAHVHLTYNYDVSSYAMPPHVHHQQHNTLFISNIISSCLDKFHEQQHHLPVTCLALRPSHADGQ